MTTKTKTEWTDESIDIYAPKSNAVFSGSVKGVDLDDYVALRQMLKFGHTGIGEYLVYAYRELDNGYEQHFDFRKVRGAR